MSFPNVAILLASYNGESYIAQQIESISLQSGVNSSVYLSDDYSSDSTVSIALNASEACSQKTYHVRFPRNQYLSKKSSANNFFHLILNVEPPPDVLWVAFSDQDDIWFPDHLSRAIESLVSSGSSGYSANVVAFWPDGTRRLVRKYGHISTYNHLFESPGPGCSFVLPRRVYDDLQAFLRLNLAQVTSIDFHDWLIFAFVRSRGLKWTIDPCPALLYRQHANNVLGVQSGLFDIFKRLSLLFGPWYFNQVLAIASVCLSKDDFLVKKLFRYSFIDRIYLSVFAWSFRRRFLDKILLTLAFLFASRLSNLSPITTHRP